jgi:hypothetical protein
VGQYQDNYISARNLSGQRCKKPLRPGVELGSRVPRSQHFSANAGDLQIFIVHHQFELIAKSILSQIVAELDNHDFHRDREYARTLPPGARHHQAYTTMGRPGCGVPTAKWTILLIIERMPRTRVPVSDQLTLPDSMFSVPIAIFPGSTGPAW